MIAGMGIMNIRWAIESDDFPTDLVFRRNIMTAPGQSLQLANLIEQCSAQMFPQYIISIPIPMQTEKELLGFKMYSNNFFLSAISHVAVMKMRNPCE